jgi:transcription-repair coupling factor (superfamily II helicase)
MTLMTYNNVVETNSQKTSLLSPQFPGPERGKRFTWNYCIGSSDASIIAENALKYRDSFSIMVVICSEPTVAQRLSQEIPLFNNTL